MPETIDYEALARQHGAIQSQPAAASGLDYAALAKQFGATESKPPVQFDPDSFMAGKSAGAQAAFDPDSFMATRAQAPAAPAEPGNHGFLEGAQHAIGEWWNQVNPIKAVEGMADVAAHPIDAIKAYGAANSHLADKAKESFQKGDYAEGLRHSLGYLLNGLPGIGSTIDEAGDKAHAGDLPGALGETAGFATMALAPELAGKVPIRAAISKVTQPLAERMYQSALKPSVAKGAEAGREVVRTGLAHGIPVSEAGAAKLAGLIDDLNGKIKDTIDAGAQQGVTIDPNAVAQRVDATRSKFARQVNPDSDLAAIDAAKNEFLSGPGAGPIPVDMAQDLKQGTYQQLRKSYGKLSGAQVEAQKALARGLKEELATTFPEIAAMNETDSKLLRLQPALDKAVARISNHDMLGLGTPIAAGAGAAIAGGPGAAAAALFKHVLDNPETKSQLALAISAGSRRLGKPIALSTAMARVTAFAKGLQPQTDERNLPLE